MTRLEFFLKAIQAGRLKEKAWVLSAFSIQMPVTEILDPRPWSLHYVKQGEGTQLIVLGEDATPIVLSDVEYKSHDPQPPYRIKDRITLNPGDIANVKKAVETTYGNLVLNWIILVFPFGDKLDYMTGKMKIKAIEKLIELKFEDQPADPEQRRADKIYPDEYRRYQIATGMIQGYSQISVPSATAKTMTRHPDTEKLRNQLLKQYEGRLHDPVVIAKIEEELLKLDAEWLKDDDAMGFYIKDKSLKVARKKMFLMMGRESAFTDAENAVNIPTALTEGWDPKNLPPMVNNIREGSFDRGASTALGGELTKFILSVMQNSTVAEEDCGSKLGVPIDIDKSNAEEMIGNFILVGGKTVELTDDNIAAHLGKRVLMRSPAKCRTERANFCATCIGKRYGGSPTALPTAASNIGSRMMYAFMKAFHGKALSIAKYKIDKHLM